MANVEYKIYQLKNPKDVEYAFLDWESAKVYDFNFNDYAIVAHGVIAENHCLGKLWEMFNIDPPLGYRGRSVSASDVIGVRKEDSEEWDWWYVDIIGWMKITDVIEGIDNVD